MPPPPPLENKIKLAIINARSSNKKRKDIINQFQHRYVDLAVISETWQKDSTGPQLEELEQCAGLTWIAKPRGWANGGGVAVVCSNASGSVRRMDFATPPELEIVWTCFTPHVQQGLRVYIAAFYSSNTEEHKPPPALQNHVMDVISSLANHSGNAHVIVAGDLNHDTLEDLLALDDFASHVTLPTRGDAFLDVAFANLPSSDCQTHPPLANDNIEGNDSDHKIVTINFHLPEIKKTAVKTITKRKFRKANLRQFEEDFRHVRWWDLASLPHVDDMVAELDSRIAVLLDKHFPLETTKIRDGQAVYFNDELKKCKARADRAYRKGGNCLKFRQRQAFFRKKLAKAKRGFFNSILDDTRRQNPKKWHKQISHLMSNSGRISIKPQPSVPALDGLSDSEKAERLAEHIARITDDYVPLDLQAAHERHAGGINKPFSFDEVVLALRKMKIPNGLHSADPPRQLIKALPHVFAVPLLIVYNKVLSTCIWPAAFKDDETVMIPKTTPTMTLKDLRPVVKVRTWGKGLQFLLRPLILNDVQPNLECAQHGGLPKMSCDHYLASLYQEIMEANQKNLTSILVTLDFSSAFDALSHEIVIEAAARLGLRPQLVRLVASFLHQRQKRVQWGDSWSAPRRVNGGSGQGSILSALLFVIAVDELLLRLRESIDETESGMAIRKSMAFSYVDDTAILLHVDRTKLKKNSQGCRIFEDDGRIEKYLKVVQDYTTKSGMKLNQSKTKVLTFDNASPRTIFDPHQFHFIHKPDPGQPEVLVNELKLLGVIIDQDLTLGPFAEARRRAGLFASWQLQRLQAQGVSQDHLKAAYVGYVRSVTEFGLLSAGTLMNATQ